jgi:hypothetical protein
MKESHPNQHAIGRIDCDVGKVKTVIKFLIFVLLIKEGKFLEDFLIIYLNMLAPLSSPLLNAGCCGVLQWGEQLHDPNMGQASSCTTH